MASDCERLASSILSGGWLNVKQKATGKSHKENECYKPIFFFSFVRFIYILYILE